MITENNKRIAKNTIVLYIRMIVTLAISLYSSRIVLKNLGVSDYGIYNVVGGVVVLFSMIGGALSGASSRFITFELGKKENSQLKTVFGCSVTVQIVMASIAVLILETAGVWFLYNKMSIEPERLQSAFWCLQFSILTCFINFISIPYNAAIIAHEKMNAFAWISIIECLGKLIIVIIIGFFSSDRLFLYGLLLALLAIVIRFIYSFYCIRNFKECRFKPVWNQKIFKEMFFFGLWSFIGTSAAILRDHGGNILLNVFFGPAVNAARGIAIQVNGATTLFVNNFMTAVGPQITKNYASNNLEEMHKLIFWGSKISFFLSFFIVLPLLVNTKFILDVWLNIVPEHTIWFVRLTLLYSLQESFSISLMNAQNATGKIRNYQLVVGGAIMLNFPLSYLCLKNGCPAEFVFIISIIVCILCFFIRLPFLKKSIHLDIRSFLKNVWGKSIISSVVAAMPIIWLCRNMDDSWLSFVASTLLCFLVSGVSMYEIGCSDSERNLLKMVMKKVFNKIRVGRK